MENRLHKGGEENSRWILFFCAAMYHSVVMGIDVIPSLYIFKSLSKRNKKRRLQTTSFICAHPSRVSIYNIILNIYITNKKSVIQGLRDEQATNINGI